ncbi:unnamed protein product, partial [Musa banksii]
WTINSKTTVTSNKMQKRKDENSAEGITRYIANDIVERVLMHMNPKDAVRLSTVCKEWSIMAQRYNPTMNKIPWLVNVEYAKGETFVPI